MSNKRMWVLSESKTKKSKITGEEKNEISTFFEPLIDKFKKELQNAKQNKEYNYVIDIYTKWYQNYFYLCEKYKSDSANRTLDEFEAKLVRLEYISKNNFNFSFLRHTGQWHLVTENITLEDCLEMIIDNPNFRPSF